MRSFEPILRSFPGRLLVWREGRSIQDADTGKRPRGLEITVGEVPASNAVAAAFDIAPGDPVIKRSRRFAVEGRPIGRSDELFLDPTHIT